MSDISRTLLYFLVGFTHAFDSGWQFRYGLQWIAVFIYEKGVVLMPKLYIISPSSVACTIDLTNNLLTIGRTEETDICIPDHNVSKRHGILVRDGDDYQLHDFNSTNGTFVDGKRIMAAKLQHGVSIRLGSVELRYESVPANATAAPLGAKQPEPGLLRSSNDGSTSSKDRGMSKRMKPEYAAGSLHQGSFAKPIPPLPPKT